MRTIQDHTVESSTLHIGGQSFSDLRKCEFSLAPD